MDHLRARGRNRNLIPWASPRAQYEAHKDDIKAAINRVLESGNYVLGKEVETFERAFATYCGSEHAVGVANGTDALALTVRALGIEAGDEVITVSHTAVATVAAILAAGAKPVLVDVDPVYYTLDPASIEAAVTKRTRAIIAVHLYGQTADIEAIRIIAQRHGLKLIEDCAQAAGGKYRGKRVGSFGDVGCFSFYPTKNLGAIGDGGIVVTSNEGLAARLRCLRQYGWDEARNSHEPGVNSRLDPLQAAILSAKLPHLESDNMRRATTALRYDAGLAGLPLDVPSRRLECEHAFHLYVIATESRDDLIAHLADCGIGAAVHYFPPVHMQKGYADRVVVAPSGLPVSTRLAQRIVSLPMYPQLKQSEADRVIAAVREFYSGQPPASLSRP